MIRKIRSEAECAEVLGVLRESFGTVAEQYGLTETVAATNPAFITKDRLEEYMNKPVEMFGLFLDEKMIGCVAIESSKNRPGVFYIERLAVVPSERHHGHGASLLSYALGRIGERGCHSASIGIMNENRVLKEWYQRQGFIETERKKLAHLPFEVCFMSKEISTRNPKEQQGQGRLQL